MSYEFGEEGIDKNDHSHHVDINTKGLFISIPHYCRGRTCPIYFLVFFPIHILCKEFTKSSPNSNPVAIPLEVFTKGRFAYPPTFVYIQALNYISKNCSVLNNDITVFILLFRLL